LVIHAAGLLIKRYIIHSLFIDDVIIWDGYFLFEQPCDNDAVGRVDVICSWNKVVFTHRS